MSSMSDGKLVGVQGSLRSSRDSPEAKGREIESADVRTAVVGEGFTRLYEHTGPDPYSFEGSLDKAQHCSASTSYPVQRSC